MKTTVKLTPAKRLTVQPCSNGGGVIIELLLGPGLRGDQTLHLSADQCGALIFGMEAALELLDVQRANCGVSA